jgi:hypothetical protein
MSLSFLLTSWGSPGNMNPFLTAAQRLSQKGHRFRFIDEACHGEEIKRAGFDHTAVILGNDLNKAWNNPNASIETRKKIIRLLIKEIIVDVIDDSLILVIHCQRDDRAELKVEKNKVGHTKWTIEADVVDLARALARQLPDNEIAAILNRCGKATAHGAAWTRTHVRDLRNSHGIRVYREGERAERGESTLDEAAELLKVSRATAYRVTAGVLPAQQLCARAPWIVRLADPLLETVRRDAGARRTRRLFFILRRRLNSRMQLIEEGDLRPEQAVEPAMTLDVPEREIIPMNRHLSGANHSLNAPMRDDSESEWNPRGKIMRRFLFSALGLGLATSCGATLGHTQTLPREDNIWGGYAHQPTQSEVTRQEKSADIAASHQEQQFANDEVERIYNLLMRKAAPPSVCVVGCMQADGSS